MVKVEEGRTIEHFGDIFTGLAGNIARPNSSTRAASVFQLTKAMESAAAEGPTKCFYSCNTKIVKLDAL